MNNTPIKSAANIENCLVLYKTNESWATSFMSTWMAFLWSFLNHWTMSIHQSSTLVEHGAKKREITIRILKAFFPPFIQRMAR